MDKELQSDLSQMTMYSKMGRYISNKILKYNKKPSNTHRNTSQSPPVQYITRIKKTKESIHDNNSKSPNRREVKPFEAPPVGYYKLSYGVVQKNPRLYNFNRSVPHFNRDKYFCNESKPALKDYPDVSTSKGYVKGLVELGRVVGRGDIKGSVRKFTQDPHESRFLSVEIPVKNDRTRVNMDKEMARDNRMFKNYQFAPEYDFDYSVNMKRLDTHILPFELIEPRDDSSMKAKTGISNFFNQDESKPELRSTTWKKMLPREKTGLIPSYMDKNINSRISISMLNLKTLEMNCSEMKQVIGKIKKKGKKEQVFMEDKENMAAQDFY